MTQPFFYCYKSVYKYKICRCDMARHVHTVDTKKKLLTAMQLLHVGAMLIQIKNDYGVVA